VTFKEFNNRLRKARTEETVKAVYAKYFKIEYNTADKHDLYTSKVLFEFKHEKNFKNLKVLATVVAQMLYYIRRLKYEDMQKTIPYYLCLADKNTASIFPTNTWSSYYSNDNYDWERPPSKPDPKLIDHIVKEPNTGMLHIYRLNLKGEHSVFKRKLETALNPQFILDYGDRKDINEDNFEAVFDHWSNILGKYIVNGYKDSFYFLSNIQKDKIIIDRENNRVVFTFEDRNSKNQKILMKDYDYFWDIYDYVSSQDIINGIHAKLDRLTDENQRRFEGEFYTPLKFGKKAIKYLTETLGQNWYKSGKYRIWDMAAGTGNLEYHLPAESYQYLYMSTLHSSEADHLKKVFPKATCFQYDYLNDDVEYIKVEDNLPFEPNWKLPLKLRNELNDKSITWVVYINPPFATAQVGGAKGESKKGVSKTKVESWMNEKNTGHAKRELFAQFMFRIVQEFPKSTYLGMFSKLKYLNAPDSIAFRDEYFSCKYESGFMFKSTNFNGVTGKYPIGFLLWNLSKTRESNIVDIDIANDNTTTVGVKHLELIDKEDVLNKWFKRPVNSKNFILPPLSNGITVKANNTDTRHRARPDFLASICSKGNDFQNANYVVILSSPSVSAGAFTVNKENFEKSLTLHAVRKIPKQTWLNDRNQFLTPRIEPSKEFYNDCVIWSLFASSNETTSLRDVEYLNEVFQIKNNFFPYVLSEVRTWGVKDPDFRQQMSNDVDRFVADWIQKKEFSDEAQKVLNQGKEVYRIFYSHLNVIATNDMKINSWDAGWYQIRRSLASHNIGLDELECLKSARDELAIKILPSIEKYGFLDKDEVFNN